MSLFGKLVRTVINVVELPIDVAKDIATLGGTATDQRESYTRQQIDKIKEEAED